MYTAVDDRWMTCAAFKTARELEGTYRTLVRSGLSSADISVLVTEDAFAQDRDGWAGLSARLRPMQGGFTGGIRMRALGPARSFGVTGSVASGLIRAGIDDAEAAWLMQALVDGEGLILVHGLSESDASRARSAFVAQGAARFVGDGPPAEQTIAWAADVRESGTHPSSPR